VLEQAAQLFEAQRDETATPRELGRHGTSQRARAAECQVLEPKRPVVLGRLALAVAKARSSDDEDAGSAKSVGVPKFQAMEKVSATRERQKRIPEEFFI